MTRSFPITIDIDSDWGVTTGAGVVGGIDSVIERDSSGRPVLRGTVLAGILRENAQVVALALDEGDPDSPWSHLCTRVFGSSEAARLITFTDAISTDDVKTDDAVSVSIDPDTQTAKDDHLRFFERAGATRLSAEVTCCSQTTGGARVLWSDSQLDDVEVLLALACGIVEAIGSDKGVGDGACRMRLGAPRGGNSRPLDWPWSVLESVSRTPTIPTIENMSAALVSAPQAADAMYFFTVPLDVELLSPVVSYEAPFSNEVRSLDFLRGTVLLAWAHAQLRAAHPDDEVVRDAVIAGDLRVSDAVAAVDGVRGLPVPLSLSRAKDSRDSSRFSVWNHLWGASGEEAQIPLRSGFLYEVNSSWGIASIPMVARQSTALDPATGTSASGQLYLVHALAPGLHLQADIVMSERLRDRLPDLERILNTEALLGARRLSGTFGRVRCSLGNLSPLEVPTLSWDGNGTTTLWFVSDLVLRSSSLGPTTGLPNVLEALASAGAEVEVLSEDGARAAAVRYRRIDSRDSTGSVRSTRIAMQSGSALRVAPVEGTDPSMVLKALQRIARDGLGELRAQGYGRVLVGHPLLSRSSLTVSAFEREAFLNRKDS